MGQRSRRFSCVALRKESVDRNMYSVNIQPFGRAVALRKESVDRNIRQPNVAVVRVSRSPQGERG